jgi:hypothetical protein
LFFRRCSRCYSIEAFALALAAVFFVACGESGTHESGVTSASSAEQAPLPAHAGADLPLPAPGEVELSVAGGRITLLANEAPLGLVLSRLALELGFEVTGLAAPLDATPVTLHITDASLEEVLRLALSNHRFALEYGQQPAGQTALVRLALEASELAAAQAKLTPKQAKRRARRMEHRKRTAEARQAEQARLAAMTPEERERLEAEKRRAREEQEARVAADLAAADPDRRSSAVAYLDDRANAEQLAAFLERDPSPRVRAEAAKTLGDVDTASSTRALVKALSDPDPEVVKEALDALQWRDDPSVIDDVRPALRHRNAEVRELAADTIQWLEK